MKKQKGGAFVNDLDVLGDMAFDEPEETVDTEVSDTDVFGDIDTPEETKTVEEVTPPVEEQKEVTEETKPADEGEDLDKRVEDLLKSTAVVEDKLDEVKSAAENSGDEDLVKLVEELIEANAQKDLEIEELKKAKEVSNNRYLSKYGEEEELSIYKPEIEKLQSNPRLMAFVKYYDTDNEKVKPKLISIASDFLYKLTGQDVSELLETKDTKAMESVLSGSSNDSPLGVPEAKAKNENMGYEESVSNILGF